MAVEAFADVPSGVIRIVRSYYCSIHMLLLTRNIVNSRRSDSTGSPLALKDSKLHAPAPEMDMYCSGCGFRAHGLADDGRLAKNPNLTNISGLGAGDTRCNWVG